MLRISRIGKFLVERLPTCCTAAGFTRTALNSLYGFLGSNQPRKRVDDVAKPTR